MKGKSEEIRRTSDPTQHSPVFRARGSADDSAKFLYQRKHSLNPGNLSMNQTVMQSPKLRNRFSLNLPMSSLRKKINRRSMPTIEDSPESNAGQLAKADDSCATSEEKQNKLTSHRSLTPPNMTVNSPNAADSVFHSPPLVRQNSVTSAEGVGLTITNVQRVTRSSDTNFPNRDDRRKASLRASVSSPTHLSPTRILDDFTPLQVSWSPGSLRRGSTPVLPSKLSPALSRHRLGAPKGKVCFLLYNCILSKP